MTKAKRPAADTSTPISRLAASFAASSIPRSGEPDDEMVCIETGHLIRRMRKKRGLTQGDLARRVGTSQSHISDLERGAGTQGPTVTLLVRIARACGETLLIVPDSEVVELRQFRALEEGSRRRIGSKDMVRWRGATLGDLAAGGMIPKGVKLTKKAGAIVDEPGLVTGYASESKIGRRNERLVPSRPARSGSPTDFPTLLGVKRKRKV